MGIKFKEETAIPRQSQFTDQEGKTVNHKMIGWYRKQPGQLMPDQFCYLQNSFFDLV